MTKLWKRNYYTSLIWCTYFGLLNPDSNIILNQGTQLLFPKGVHIIKNTGWYLAIIVILFSLTVTLFNTEQAVAEGETVVNRGETIQITATLLQNGTYGYPVSNQKIFFFDQTFNIQLGSDTTDMNGIASISWIIPLNHTLGLTTINATFFGNSSLSLAPSCQWTILTILSSTTIEIDQIPDLLAPGDILHLSVHLTDDSHYPIPNATIAVFKDNIPLALYTTNSTGEIHFEIECNSSWITLGDNNIRVVYEQDLVNFLDTSEYTFTFEISKIQTSLTLQGTYQNKILLNEFVDFYVELSEINNPIPNEFLEIFLDGQPLFSTTSNSSGIAHFHMLIDERFTLGLHTLRIHYNGSERYSESYSNTFIEVTSPVQIIIKVPESVIIGSSVKVEITASDLLGRIIPSSRILISDSPSNQRFTINANPSETTTIFLYELQGPVGVHILNIEITDNSFILNTSSSSTFIAWSSLQLLLEKCNVDHYASPGQEVIFEIHMSDWAGNSSFRQLQLLIDNDIQFSVVTDFYGQTILSFSVPYIENQYNISVFYNGNTTLFELPVKFDYSLRVTSVMPLRLELNFYETIIPLRELSVHLTVRCLNGSTPKGVQVSFEWLDLIFDIRSNEGGTIELHLMVPVASGNYFLYYESETSKSISSTSGSFLINITKTDVMSLEGIGIIGLTIAFIASVGLSTIPIIRRKYLVG